MKTPTLPECHGLFDTYKVPAGTVKVHCEAVHKVAVALAEQLIQKGFLLDLNIIQPFSLLHDLMKSVVLERLDGPPYHYQPTAEEIQMHQQLRKQYVGMSETKVAYLVLQDNYPEFAKLFTELDELTQNPQAKVHEETKFIHYVDWRVLGNKIVPLSERMNYIYNRYSHWIKKRNIDWEAVQQDQFNYERKLFSLLPYPPEQLKVHISL
ncbi:hypothetical protein HYX14_01935 [Candidatus Woesearchaeota archaeon]|nr:hypothetical protein [Candidatus Woesearchaeota archaeon]